MSAHAYRVRKRRRRDGIMVDTGVQCAVRRSLRDCDMLVCCREVYKVFFLFVTIYRYTYMLGII